MTATLPSTARLLEGSSIEELNKGTQQNKSTSSAAFASSLAACITLPVFGYGRCIERDPDKQKLEAHAWTQRV